MLNFQRGFDITRKTQASGGVPVVSSGGIASFHDTAAAAGPGVVIGRKGTLGKVFYLPGHYWPHDTTLWIQDFKGNLPRFVYYFMKQFDTSWLDAGSANPTLNRNHLHPLRVSWPTIHVQQAIAEVLGAFDDKIAANTKLATTADDLAGVIYDHAVAGFSTRAMSEVLNPILGGTPSRTQADFWVGDQYWASAKDITSANFGVITGTIEQISLSATTKTKAKPLPAGSVILTARGTVGAVARLAVPASFNQSCYGFIPDTIPSGMLYLAIKRATQRAKAIAHGSVFDTITMKTFDHLSIPDLRSEMAASIEEKISPLLDCVSEAVVENQRLAATRDALLPQLMSGKLRVKDAEKALEDAGV
ncbi:restriction endonuclease subunit S [Arthrobacter echini]|uniref:restriction endonuclease subunit S n=1 Tax=Arthrobacter echini TaxID=1529066 RepID=UPI00145607E2|nr:restriction endonuclease subunit S [Arthrobacter echini]